MVLCDPEEEYAQLMTEFLKKHKELPWKIRTYTSVDDLLRTEKAAVGLLVVSEAAYSEELQSIQTPRIIVLNESGVVRWENVCYVDKVPACG